MILDAHTLANMRRSKQNTAMWTRNILQMIQDVPNSESVENRYKAIRYLLLPVYPQLNEIPKETLLSILKDVEYVSRQLRLFNEDNQKDLKEELEAEKIIELQS